MKNKRLEMKPKKTVRNREICGQASVFQQMESTGSSFLPWEGSFRALKKEKTFRSLLENNDYVLAAPAEHCLPSKSGSRVNCKQGFHIETFDCIF